MPNLVEGITSSFSVLRQLLVACGRLHWMALLGQSSMFEKCESALRASFFIEAAHQVEDFAERSFQCPCPQISRSETELGLLSAVMHDGCVHEPSLRDLIGRVAATIEHLRATMIETVRAVDVMAPTRCLLDGLRLPECSTSSNKTSVDFSGIHRQDHPIKSIVGPRSVNIDAAFDPTYSLMDRPAPQFTEAITDIVPYLWTLSMRESTAAEVCALSGIEYDGLPLGFYRDMAKQIWDEARHAVMFFQLSQSLFPELISDTSSPVEVVECVQRFQQIGAGLPVPRERSLYEAMWNADLAERLVLLQLDTEGPAIGRLRAKLKSSFALSHPQMELGWRIDSRDETSHAAIGTRWLRYIVPNKIERAQAVTDARTLRAILLLTPVVHYGPLSLSELLDRYTSGNTFPEPAAS